MAERLPANLLKPLADLGKWLDAVDAQAVVVGGVAASFLGRPRFTQDIDALAILSESAWEAAIATAAAHGIEPRMMTQWASHADREFCCLGTRNHRSTLMSLWAACPSRKVLLLRGGPTQ